MKIFILKAIKQLIYGFSEYTPPEVKHSNRNQIVAAICFSIDKLISDLKSK
jgi:hypothetical protein